ncbi:hypothetical protein SOP93_16975 [Peribacillus frigoritolerans]|uniref:hypothetical protein n=1 Tax=Peribacillus frigoritolerans TaxID=450367 RepID=UPI002B24FBB1|nr:hypothetical protein [Peribacillus frigoritolerans]MEB2492860.1 hypothetical protein [Peribacillus frigoritolerans]
MKGNNKNKSMKILIGLLVILVIFIFLFPIIMDKFIIGNQYKSNISNDDWVSFLGSYVGAIVSGIITFLVLYITIQHENKKLEKEQEKNEQLRLEDKRMSVLPYFSYSIIDDKKANEIEKELQSCLVITPKDYEQGKEGELNIDVRFNVCIENLGLGIAIEPRLVTIEFDGIKNELMTENIVIINLNEKAFLPFNVVLPKGEVGKMKLKLGYYNLFRDYYEQEIIIEFEQILEIIKGVNNEIVGKEIKYKSAQIIEVSKAIINEFPDNRRIRIKMNV